MANTTEMVRAIEHSNLPKPEKASIFRRLLNRGSSSEGRSGGGLSRYMPRQKHAVAGLAAVRQSGEALLTGAVLGAIKAESKTNSLDMVMGDPTKTHLRVPIDGALAAVATIAQIGLAGEPGSADAGNIAAGGWAVLAFRKTDEFVAKRKAAAGTGGTTAAVHGDFGADPILAASRSL